MEPLKSDPKATSDGSANYEFSRVSSINCRWQKTEDDYRNLLPPYLDPSRLNHLAA
jgi:hypothetical protein